jgi:hypothetical protein
MKKSYKGQSRREFIKNSALIGAVIATNPFKFAEYNEIKIGSWPAIKERITPIAIIQDAGSLLSRDVTLGHVITEALHEELNLAFCGTSFEKGKQFFPEVLKSVKSAEWGDEVRYKKASIVIGWLIYREMPAVFTPLYKQESSEKGRLYRDAAVLKYKIEFLSTINAAEFEDMLKLMWHRAAVRMHTLTPDRQEWETWLENFADWYYQDRQTIEQYAKLVKKENSSEWNEFVDKPGFFSEDDHLIELANDFSYRTVSLDPGLLNGNGKSMYSKALSKGISSVKLLDQYFKEDISEKEIMNRLDIG